MSSIRKSSPLLLALGTALLMSFAPAQAQNASGADAAPTFGPGPATQPQRRDALQHAQFRLNELQRKLSPSADQKSAWDTWSSAELQALKQGIEQHQAWQAAHAPQGQPPAEPSTPQRMAQAIAHLRDHKYLLDQHLQQLEARQVRTQAFYDTLDAKQKTIFDLLVQPGPHGPGPHGMGGPGGPGAHEAGPGFRTGPGPGAAMKAPRQP